MTDDEIVQKVNNYWSKRGIKANARLVHDVVKINGAKHLVSQVVTDAFLKVPKRIEDAQLYGDVKEIKLRKIKNISV
jgi:hypothetical protein